MAICWSALLTAQENKTWDDLVKEVLLQEKIEKRALLPQIELDINSPATQGSFQRFLLQWTSHQT